MSIISQRTGNPSSENKPVLIVTATKVETQAVLDIFSVANGQPATHTPKGISTYYDLGIHGDVPVQLVQSEKGTSTRGGALSTVHNAIPNVTPQAIILCGIACGMRPESQQLGDLLISEKIECYEPQKIDKNQGQLQRGERVGPPERLLNRFRSADNGWKGVKTHFGLIMSGEKLVNDPEFLAWLKKVGPEVIGCEMEAAGLYVAASAAKVDWIVVKAICDWGDGNKNDDAQKQAAKNAAQFVLHVLKYGITDHEISQPDEMNNDKLANPPEDERPPVTSQGEPEYSDKNDPEQRWLKEVGLRENPFRHWDAEERDPYLPDYFSRSTELQQVTTSQLTRERKTWFFGGDEGYGKTALRRFLAAKGRPTIQVADMICFEVDQREFERLIPQLEEITDFNILFFRAMVEKCLHMFPGEILNMPFTWHSQGKVLENIANLSAWLREHGVDWILCLVDPSKESFTWKGSQIPITSFLKPLITSPESGGVGLRFFLPTTVKDDLKKEFPPTAKNERRYMQIQWDEASLVKLIAKRMTILSVDQSAPFRSFGQICENDLTPLVDAEIASLAQGSPRAAVWLANRLMEVHCQEDSNPPALISRRDWDTVKSAWWEGGKGWILGSSKPDKFLVSEERVVSYRGHEIILGASSYSLFYCLATARDGFRSNDELIQARWPGENPSGIPEKTLSEAVRRMKNELISLLKSYGVDVSGSKWVKSVRKRGYRLVHPGIVTKDEEGE